MKIEIGNMKFTVGAWIVVLALAAIVITAVICATNNFQSLELRASRSLHARNHYTASTNLTPSTISTGTP
jgi:hypothetical protein